MYVQQYTHSHTIPPHYICMYVWISAHKIEHTASFHVMLLLFAHLFKQPTGNFWQVSFPRLCTRVGGGLQEVLKIIRESSDKFDTVCMATCFHMLASMGAEPADYVGVLASPEIASLKTLIGERFVTPVSHVRGVVEKALLLPFRTCGACL